MAGACGKIGQACCGSGVECTAAYSTCNNNQCVACGGLNQRCCPSASGRSYCGTPFTCNTNNNRCQP
jgi:hypothetical protein